MIEEKIDDQAKDSSYYRRRQAKRGHGPEKHALVEALSDLEVFRMHMIIMIGARNNAIEKYAPWAKPDQIKRFEDAEVEIIATRARLDEITGDLKPQYK